MLIVQLYFFSFEFLLLSLSHFLLKFIFFLNLCELLILRDMNSLCHMLQIFSPNFLFALKLTCVFFYRIKASLFPHLLLFSIFKVFFCPWCPMKKSSLQDIISINRIFFHLFTRIFKSSVIYFGISVSKCDIHFLRI